MAFVDCVNRGDVDGLGRLMTADHVLRVLDEDPVAGRAANLDGWRERRTGGRSATPTAAAGRPARRQRPVQVGSRFSRNAQIPSWASAASMFIDITVFVRSYARGSSRSIWA